MTKTRVSILMAAVASLVVAISSVDAFQALVKASTQDRADHPAVSSLRSRVHRRHAEDPLSEATQKLKEAVDDDQREQAMEEIRTELEKQYDRFLADNEHQIDELQQRLDDLKDQLVRRRRAKDKMVDLELERVINKSEGLIWPQPTPRRVYFGLPARMPADEYRQVPSWRTETRTETTVPGFPWAPTHPPAAPATPLPPTRSGTR